MQIGVTRFVVAAARLAALMLAAALSTPAYACDFPPPAIHDLDLKRFYTDTAGSTTTPELLAEHDGETKRVRSYLRKVEAEADASFLQPTESLGRYRAKCALEWLEVWGRGDALLGKIASKQAASERRWSLAGAALAYLKVKPAAEAEQSQVIEAWLGKLAAASETQFAEDNSKHNNHHYWLGLGLAATSIATGDTKMWERARAIMQEATASIDASGALPLEVARQARALHYHAFALMPLTAMAELARSRGEDWYKFNNGALDRLAALTVKGIEDPDVFKKLSGFDQEQPLNVQSGWLALYRLQHPTAFPDIRFEMPSGHQWLGGNVLLLGRALSAGTPKNPNP